MCHLLPPPLRKEVLAFIYLFLSNLISFKWKRTIIIFLEPCIFRKESPWRQARWLTRGHCVSVYTDTVTSLTDMEWLMLDASEPERETWGLAMVSVASLGPCADLLSFWSWPCLPLLTYWNSQSHSSLSWETSGQHSSDLPLYSGSGPCAITCMFFCLFICLFPVLLVCPCTGRGHPYMPYRLTSSWHPEPKTDNSVNGQRTQKGFLPLCRTKQAEGLWPLCSVAFCHPPLLAKRLVPEP